MTAGEASERPRGEWRRRAAVLALSTLAALVTAEVGLRAAAHRRNQRAIELATRSAETPLKGARVALGDIIRLSANERIVYELRPNLVDVPFKGGTLSTNSHGFRGAEIGVGTPEGTITIVALGDSVLFGHGVSDDETLPHYLEERLALEYPAARWRVVNTGVPGYNTVMQVETLRAKGLAFEPDIVLWTLVPNDLELPPYVRNEEAVFDPTRSFLAAWVREQLAPEPELVTHALLGHLPAPPPESQRRRATGEEDFDLPEDLPDHYDEMVGWEPFERAADELMALSEERGFRVIAFANYVDAAVEGMIERVEAHGVPVFTLTDELMAHMKAIGKPHFRNTDLVVSRENLHPSPLQHRMACDKVMEGLRGLGWLEELAAR